MEESEECGWEGNEQSQQQQQQQQLMCFRIGFILYLLRRKKYHHHHHHHHQHHHHHHHYKTTTAAGDKMTVTYTTKVSNTSFCGFSKLLFRWRGSVFKLLAADLIVYFLLYFSVAAIYRFALRENEKRVFEKIAITCEYFRNVFPISFVLGFYVTIVVQRWWEQYMLIPWPDTVCIMASTYIEGQVRRSKREREGERGPYTETLCSLTTTILKDHRDDWPGSQDCFSI
ncbi:hypothetical protein O3P69_015521 [Scylla paramamosain]|uniref:Bestrophin homolog n=1 Tax=Scylla paramamosain TaxID=85552 RepID=A0AAW0SDQ8_SCYPA